MEQIQLQSWESEKNGDHVYTYLVTAVLTNLGDHSLTDGNGDFWQKS